MWKIYFLFLKVTSAAALTRSMGAIAIATPVLGLLLFVV